MRKLCYITGTRADFGLMKQTLKLINADPDIELSLCVTGSHFSKHFSASYPEVKDTGIKICGEIKVDNDDSSQKGMAIAIGREIIGFSDLFAKEKFDCIMILGDRGEPLAAAIAAIHLNVPIIHIHGGELSGTIDESIRHAISKLSHYHFVATEQSKERLIKMGERPEHIFITGAPGLDGLTDRTFQPREALCKSVGYDPLKKIALCVYHPIVQEIKLLAEYIQHALEAALENNLQLICLTPNTDAGGSIIRQTLANYSKHPAIRCFEHFQRETYLDWLSNVDLMLGNSSSAIIEAASFNLPVVNIGSRQNAREKSANTIDSLPDKSSIDQAIKKAMEHGKVASQNVYGDGKTSERMLKLVKELPLNNELLKKLNAY